MTPRASLLWLASGILAGGCASGGTPSDERSLVPASVTAASAAPPAASSAPTEPVVASAAPSPPGPTSAGASPSALASVSASAAVAPPDPEEPPPGLDEKTARGQCTGWAEVTATDPRGKGRKWPIRCYPFRCKVDRCLLSCRNTDDCAGSRGPGDFAEHGWPLKCVNGTCVPLPPNRVHP